MEKRKEKADLEQLLNSLIEKGWKPNGKEYNHIHAEYNRIMSDFGTFYRFCNYVENGSINRCLNLKLREIVSINSGLWQFVCENGMVNDNKQYSFIKRSWKGRTDEHNQKSYKYRLIESSLKDENELEDFLLNSIKLD